jgi:glutamate-1-semialdehyde 2,1-aminomutase
LIATTDACDRANASAAAIRDGLNQVIEELRVPWAAYGTFSGVHLFTNPAGREVRPADFDPFSVPYGELKTKQNGINHRVRIGMLLHGVDFNNWPGGTVSSVLSPQDVAETVDAFRETLRLLRREGDLDR